MRVFHSEASQVNLRLTIGNIIKVCIGIKKEIGSVHHPDPAKATKGGIGHVQAVQKDRVPIVDTIPFGGFVNRD